MRRICVVSVLLAVLPATVGAASASALKLCVPRKEGSALVTPKHGKCKKGYKLTNVGAEGRQGKQGKPGSDGKTGPEGKAGTAGFGGGELETLKSLLSHVKFVGVGVGGKPTIQFSGVNVQIVNGEGKTASVNGEGNLVIGYDENKEGKHQQTGSHDLVLGEEQTFTSFGGLVAGWANQVTGAFASVTGGMENSASAPESSVTGGLMNSAPGGQASVGGGRLNTASGDKLRSPAGS